MEKKWIKSPWKVSVVAIIFTWLIAMGYDYSKGNPILTKVSELSTILWNIVYGFLDWNIKMWWLIAAFLLFIFILYLIIHFKHKAQK